MCALLTLSACSRSAPPVTHAAATPERSEAPSSRGVRATGIIQPVRFFTVQVPQMSGQSSGRLTLTMLVPNGSAAKAGVVVAEFDRTTQLDNARDANAKFDDLSHQVEQRIAQNRADAAKRNAELEKARADVAKAEIELRKGPLLAEIRRLAAEVKLADAREHVASLEKSRVLYDKAAAAALRILELQRDRQKVSLERALRNSEKLQIKAPLEGMVALESVWRNGSMGPAQEGDQLWPGQPLMRIFDPSHMEVRVSLGEPDGAVLGPGARAEVRLDAYPDLVFRAAFESASPAAASAIGSPIKSFAARFRLERSDPHLLPDLSAAVVIEPAERGKP
ncbi:MAG TPA: efflux RND transporter periplasmic adaptor subunit [Bryobacteraceae bacterium]|nr:efflux RND transporter periplasmic adaptor subunit [Bryobacteraceae bacterium]